MAIIATILPIFFALLAILNFILFILVLIKQFKASVLKGILGIITCGLFTFIWGWIKHKQLEITKIMLIWTATTVIPFLLQVILIFTGIGMFMSDFSKMTSLKPPPPPPVVQKRVMKPGPKAVPKAPTQKIAPVPAKSPAPKVTVDYAFEMKKVEALLKLNDKNGDAFYNRGWLYEYKGDLQMAEQDYSKAIELNKKDGDAYFNRGLIYVKTKKYDQAINDFSEVIKRQPHAAAAFCNRGNAHFQKGAMDLALNDYDAGLKIDPKDGDLYYNRALVHLAKQDQAKAEEDLRRAADLGHDKARARLKLPHVKTPGPDAGAEKTAGIEAADLSKVKIPATTASGKIHGMDFTVESAKVENGILTLRQGKDFFPDRAVMIFLFLEKGESVDGKTYNISVDHGIGAGAPHIHMKWRQEGKDIPETEMFMKQYAMRLVFGKRQGGTVQGKIFLSLPDKLKSSVAGTFVADVK